MNTPVAAVAALAVLRLAELGYARFCAARLKSMGAVFVRQDGYGAIVAVQTGLLVGCGLEAWFTPWAAPTWAVGGWAALAGGIALRYWSMAALGPRWNTRVFVLRDAPLVARGPYRFLRHPIYLGVTLEVLGLGILCSAWITLAAVVPLHTIVTLRRIRLEEGALGLRPIHHTEPDRS